MNQSWRNGINWFTLRSNLIIVPMPRILLSIKNASKTTASKRALFITSASIAFGVNL